MNEYKKEEKTKINLPAMVRDIAIHAISRGQIIPVAMFLMVIVVIFRLPPETLGEIVKDLISKALHYSALGYSFSIIIMLSWYIHMKYLNKIHEQEINRIAEERTRLQEKLTPGDIQSSKEG